MRKEKLVIVKSIGQIPVLYGVTGPILKPFLLDTNTIMHLLVTRKIVHEVDKETGKEVRLNLNNYESDNFADKKKNNQQNNANNKQFNQEKKKQENQQNNKVENQEKKKQENQQNNNKEDNQDKKNQKQI